MKYTQIKLISILSLISLCANCGRLIDWAKCNFYQGMNLEIPYDIICRYRQSVTIYDQLTTRAHFDALYLSDQIKEIYVWLHARRHNYSPTKQNMLLRRQLEENNHYLTFYVLSLKSVLLGSINSDWTIVLEIDGDTYVPDEIKKVALLPEYKQFFQDRYNMFKAAYQVRFYKKHLDGSPRIPAHFSQVILHVNTHDKTAQMSWNRDEYNNWV